MKTMFYFRNLILGPALAAICFFAGQSAGDAGAAETAQSGKFTVLTYNVAGLPEGISQSHPLLFMKRIGPLLNGFDLVLTQEDFFYGKELKAGAEHPYYDGRSRAGILGDGLSRFSIFPLGEATHVAWEVCHGTLGYANDCLTPKGFSVAAHELAPGVEIDVYDLHMDAGGNRGDQEARDQQMAQLIAFMAERSAGKAVIVAGDWNISGKRERDRATLQRLLDEQGLVDSCRALNCGRERIDRILFRGNDNIKIKAVAYRVEAERFRTRLGLPLSDHKAVSVEFEWELKND